MTEQHLAHFPWDDIPDEDVLETGEYLMKGEELTDGASNSGKRMFKARMSVMEPVMYAGMSHFENYVTGNDSQLGGIIPGEFGSRRMKQNFIAAQIPASGDPAVLCAGYVNSVFGVTMVKYTVKEGEYKGSLSNRITAYWKVGEKAPGVAAGAGLQVGVPSAAVAVAPTMAGAPVAPAVPVGGASAVGAVSSMPIVTATAVPAPVVVPVAQPAIAPPIAPVAPPVTVVGPAPVAPPIVGPVVEQPVAPAMPPPQQAPAVAAAGSIQCSICNTMVDASDPNKFSEHVKACAAANMQER